MNAAVRHSYGPSFLWGVAGPGRSPSGGGLGEEVVSGLASEGEMADFDLSNPQDVLMTGSGRRTTREISSQFDAPQQPTDVIQIRAV